MPETRSTSLERVLPKLAKFALVAVAGALVACALAGVAFFYLTTWPYRSTHRLPGGHDGAARAGALVALLTAITALIEARHRREALLR